MNKETHRWRRWICLKLTSLKALFPSVCHPDEPVLRAQIFWDNIVVFKNSFRPPKNSQRVGERGKDRHDYLDDILFFVLSIKPLFFFSSLSAPSCLNKHHENKNGEWIIYFNAFSKTLVISFVLEGSQKRVCRAIAPSTQQRHLIPSAERLISMDLIYSTLEELSQRRFTFHLH